MKIRKQHSKGNTRRTDMPMNKRNMLQHRFLDVREQL